MLELNQMSTLGLIFIVVGWIIQYRAGKKLHPMFVGSYIAGVALLILENYQGGLTLTLALNLITLVLASFTLWNLSKRK